jgi:hypothetical protein
MDLNELDRQIGSGHPIVVKLEGRAPRLIEDLVRELDKRGFIYDLQH